VVADVAPVPVKAGFLLDHNLLNTEAAEFGNRGKRAQQIQRPCPGRGKRGGASPRLEILTVDLLDPSLVTVQQVVLVPPVEAHARDYCCGL
jgi:hypothetical protein